jgi:1,4-dihydroxy-6-naphthoate synthase
MTEPDDRPILRLGHSPDPDDAFMWWPLQELDGRPSAIDTGAFRFRAVTDDIEALNRRSASAELEITAMSCAQYPHVQALYAITACGSSMGEGYGPKLVARRPMGIDDLRSPQVSIAIPGIRTSAYGAMRLMLGETAGRCEVIPFDEIIDRVGDGSFDAGLVIHEGQLTFEAAGLHLVADVGKWWTDEHGLPMPLGINAIRRDLERTFGEGTLAAVTGTLRRSVEHALAHRDESITFALEYARDMGAALADEFVRLYVNKWTLEFGEVGRRAVGAFLARLAAAGIAPETGEIDFIAGTESG